MLPFTRVCRRRAPFHMIAGRAMPSEPSRPGPRADAAGVRLVEAPAVPPLPLPGPRPVRRGIVVPEDFALPEGYVRHYQMTDDGRQLPPILMFHPDYQFVDERGAPVPLPEDRVVPPDMAPAGLPIRMLEPGATDLAP